MSREKTIGVLSLCAGFLCVFLAIELVPTFRLVKLPTDVNLSVIGSEYVRHDLTEFEKKQYEGRKGMILSEYRLLRRDEIIARRSAFAMLIVGVFNGIVGIILLSKRRKMAEPIGLANAASPRC